MQRLDQFTLTHGLVELRYPSEMTADDVKDFEDTLAIILRGIRRRNSGVLDAGQGAEAVRLNGDLGSRSTE